MSFTVRLRRSGSTVYTFSTPTPFVEVSTVPAYDTDEPPVLAGLDRTWTVTGYLRGATEAATITAWDALKSVLDTAATAPDGIQLLRDGNVVDSIATEQGYEGVRVLSYEAPRSDLQWRGEVRFSIRVTGRKRLATTVTSAGTISLLETTESWSYSESGLLTHTLRGRVEVSSGSAVSVARLLGLTNPGGSFAFSTNGPEGVDVEQLDAADRSASFVSTVQEAGATLPGSVGAGFRKTTTTETASGFTVTTVEATAVGIGAEAAVRAARPGGTSSERVSVDPFGRSATATYVVKAPVGGSGSSVLRAHRITTRGGGRPRRFSVMSGGRPPIAHLLAFEPVEVDEEGVVEVVGNAPGTDLFKIPTPVPGLVEDTNRLALSAPERVEIGRDRAQDRWQVRFSRGYVATSLATAYAAASKQALVPGGGSTPSAEAQRQGAP